MIETAKVLKVEKDSIIVNVTGTSSCSSCAMSGHCAFTSSSKTILPKPKDVEIKEGDYVEFETSEHLSATKLSVLLYGIPLVIIIGGTMVLVAFTKIGNLESLGISVAGSGIYYWILNRYTKKHEDRYSPYHVRKIEPPENINIERLGDLK